jgi:hypothetical protein
MKPRKPTAVVVILALSLLVGAAPAAADIKGGEMIIKDNVLRTQCYQHGTKIVDIDGLDGLNLGTVLRDNVMMLKRDGEDGASVIVVPMDETVCVVTTGQ